MQVHRFVLLVLFVVYLSWFGMADKEDVPSTEDAVPESDEPEVEVESEADAPEEKVRFYSPLLSCKLLKVC